MPNFKQIGGPPNLVIDAMYAFVAQGEEGEGVMGAMTGDGVMMPLVGADMKRILSLIPVADQISKVTGIPYKIYKFSNKQDITDAVKGALN